MLLAYGLVRDQLAQELSWLRKELDRLEGQRVQGGVLRIRGMDAPLLPAVGSAPTGSRTSDITTPADRFLFTSARKELPVLSAHEITKPRGVSK